MKLIISPINKMRNEILSLTTLRIPNKIGINNVAVEA